MARRGLAPDLERRVGHVLTVLSRLSAYFGGIVLTGIAVMTVVSIAGRALVPVGLGPIPGDFELVEVGCAVAVFAFLPWCQMKRGHVAVDIVSARLPARGHAFLGFLGDIALAVGALVIAWRLWFGFGERFPYGSDGLRAALGFGYKPFSVETTFILGMPVWYGYTLAFIGAVLFALVCLYTVWRSLNWTLRGAEGQPE